MHTYLQNLAKGTGFLTYGQFTNAALYHPEYGYYSKPFNRVGKSQDTDFYTSMSIGKTFGKLVIACIAKLVPSEDLSRYTFVEIAAEPDTSILNGLEHPFGSHQTIRLQDPLQVSGKVVVFSNEWLDAQPFHRLVHREGSWKEVGVQVNEQSMEEIELDEISPEIAPWIDRLPRHFYEGYQFDVPVGAETLLDQLLSQKWTGLFLTMDYGKSLQELLEITPQGTARAYHKHQQSNDLLQYPGEQDLTCHLCWDWLENLLQQHHFDNIRNLRQESFFMRNAANAIQEILESPSYTEVTGQLKELLHPSHLGHKFQALYGYRSKKH